MITDVIAAEVGAELKAMVPARPSEVVNELVLGDVATLREVPLETNGAIGWTKRVSSPKYHALRKRCQCGGSPGQRALQELSALRHGRPPAYGWTKLSTTVRREATAVQT